MRDSLPAEPNVVGIERHQHVQQTGDDEEGVAVLVTPPPSPRPAPPASPRRRSRARRPPGSRARPGPPAARVKSNGNSRPSSARPIGEHRGDRHEEDDTLLHAALQEMPGPGNEPRDQPDNNGMHGSSSLLQVIRGHGRDDAAAGDSEWHGQRGAPEVRWIADAGDRGARGHRGRDRRDRKKASACSRGHTSRATARDDHPAPARPRPRRRTSRGTGRTPATGSPPDGTIARAADGRSRLPTA